MITVAYNFVSLSFWWMPYPLKACIVRYVDFCYSSCVLRNTVIIISLFLCTILICIVLVSNYEPDNQINIADLQLLSDASHQPNLLIEDNLYYMLNYSLPSYTKILPLQSSWQLLLYPFLQPKSCTHLNYLIKMMSIQHEVMDKVKVVKSSARAIF